jgi:hypothetical protein
LLQCVLLAFVFSACSEDTEPDPLQMGYQYYPLAIGDYRIYQVTSISIQFDKPDTSRYQIREIVKSSFIDQANTLNYRIERSLRPNNNSKWDADSVFVVAKSPSNVVLTRDNTKRVKLVFPVKNGKSWEGDAFNDHVVDQTKEPYRYSSVGEPFTINDKKLLVNNTALRFDSTVTVIQGIPKEDILSIDDRKEVYAAGVGMIYKQFKRALLCARIPGCVNHIKDGNERHEVLIQYGKL